MYGINKKPIAILLLSTFLFTSIIPSPVFAYNPNQRKAYLVIKKTTNTTDNKNAVNLKNTANTKKPPGTKTKTTANTKKTTAVNAKGKNYTASANKNTVRLNKKTDNSRNIDAKTKNLVSKVRINAQNLLVPSNVSTKLLDARLKNTKLEGLGKYFVEAERRFGVNAIFLCALAIHESNWGNSRIAQDKNNLFGFRAYDRSPYESAAAFKSYGDCILYVGKYLRDNYLTKGGKYYKGTSIIAVNKSYATDKNWAYKVWNHMVNLLKG